MNPTEKLIRVGQDYVREHGPENLIGAMAGGSVGRGDADEWSDLDLTLFVSEPQIDDSKNMRYRETYVQLQTATLPRQREIMDDPWDHRFLLEAKIVYDPALVLQDWLGKATEYLQSNDGQQKMKIQALDIIQSRLDWMDRSLREREPITAGIAARAALTDAAFYYAFFTKGSLSTGELFHQVRDHPHLKEMESILFPAPEIEVSSLLDHLQGYRRYMRDSFGTNFSLDMLQDEFDRLKAGRYTASGELDNLFMQIRSEALWCYLSVSADIGVSFDRHYAMLPESIQKSLFALGYTPYTQEQTEHIRSIVRTIVKLVCANTLGLDDSGLWRHFQ